ncbi:hypothetical protein HELRODRAFT_171717 [Helobdella robusta]|uniref:Uncharacterized protein n=1 Tax=Helobdella robusta TaxID=6412 RepID=T1F4K9_HELRO|nr:hypothetical protein HELRODRAFT_171717 [Helobdella robusta]ESO05341.1 hypothetical protein HELRODRAFT_171717 [Helobdella robusta]
MAIDMNDNTKWSTTFQIYIRHNFSPPKFKRSHNTFSRFVEIGLPVSRGLRKMKIKHLIDLPEADMERQAMKFSTVFKTDVTSDLPRQSLTCEIIKKNIANAKALKHVFNYISDVTIDDEKWKDTLAGDAWHDNKYTVVIYEKEVHYDDSTIKRSNCFTNARQMFEQNI